MKEFRAIFPISSILVIRSGYAKKGHFPILAVFQNVWNLHKFACRFEFTTQKLPYELEFQAIFPISPIFMQKRIISHLAVRKIYTLFT